MSFSRSLARTIATLSSDCINTPFCPSSVRYTDSAVPRNRISTLHVSPTTSGRSLNVCGQIGVKIMDSTAGCTIGPPADSEYAVDPVGVATINPSARYRHTKSSSIDNSISIIRASAPLVITASFKTNCDSTTSSSRKSDAFSITRSLAESCPASVPSSAEYSSPNVKLVKKPKLPRLTGKIGIPRGAASRAAASNVPSPPNTNNKSDSNASCSRGRPPLSSRNDTAVSVSYNARIPRFASHSSSGRTISVISARRGREKIPIARKGRDAMNAAILPQNSSQPSFREYRCRKQAQPGRLSLHSGSQPGRSLARTAFVVIPRSEATTEGSDPVGWNLSFLLRFVHGADVPHRASLKTPSARAEKTPDYLPRPPVGSPSRQSHPDRARPPHPAPNQ